MVEVIQHGNKAITDCDFCGAVLRYTTEDIKERETFISQRDSCFEKYIVCPDCKSKVILSRV